MVPNAILGDNGEEEKIFSEFEFVASFAIKIWEKGRNNIIINKRGTKIKPIYSFLFVIKNSFSGLIFISPCQLNLMMIFIIF